MRKQQQQKPNSHSDKTEDVNIQEARKTAAAVDTSEVKASLEHSIGKREQMSVKNEDSIAVTSGKQVESNQDMNSEADLSRDNFFLDDIKRRRKLKEKKKSLQSSTDLDDKKIEDVDDRNDDDDVFSFAKKLHKENKKKESQWLKIKL